MRHSTSFKPLTCRLLVLMNTQVLISLSCNAGVKQTSFLMVSKFRLQHYVMIIIHSPSIFSVLRTEENSWRYQIYFSHLWRSWQKFLIITTSPASSSLPHPRTGNILRHFHCLTREEKQEPLNLNNFNEYEYGGNHYNSISPISSCSSGLWMM